MIPLLLTSFFGLAQPVDLIGYAFSDENYDLAFEIDSWRCTVRGKSEEAFSVKGRPQKFVLKLAQQRCFDQTQASCEILGCVKLN